jgi:co-chaperonin GroES (HSP10)
MTEKLISPIIPINDYLVVLVARITEKTKSGLFIAQNEKSLRKEQQRDSGIVVAISPNAFRFAFDKNVPVKVGDRIMFNTYSGQERVVRLDGEELRYRVIRDEEVRGIMTCESDNSELSISEWASNEAKQLDTLFSIKGA